MGGGGWLSLFTHPHKLTPHHTHRPPPPPRRPQTTNTTHPAQLESGTVDDELAALKKGLLTNGSSGNGPVAALPEGRPLKDAIDVELEELRKKARE
jgi:hypothetical protein